MSRNVAGTAVRYAAGMMQYWIATCPAAALLAALAISTLAPASAATNEGGSRQVGAQSGCMNKWMFDGVWRLRVTKVAYAAATVSEPNSWDVTMQWGNGTTNGGLRPTDSFKKDLVIALKNGDTLSADDTTDGTLVEQKLDYHALPASGQFTFTQSFYSTAALDQTNSPAKLLVTFDVAKYRAANPNGTGTLWRQKTLSPNYRIDLTCGG